MCVALYLCVVRCCGLPWRWRCWCSVLHFSVRSVDQTSVTWWLFRKCFIHNVRYTSDLYQVMLVYSGFFVWSWNVASSIRGIKTVKWSNTSCWGNYCELRRLEWWVYYILLLSLFVGRRSVVGIATTLRAGRSGDRIPVGGEIFRSRSDRPWGPPSLLYNGYRVSFPGIKRPGRGVDHPPSFSPLWAFVDRPRENLTFTFIVACYHLSLG
jgi:hypothetical protein